MAGGARAEQTDDAFVQFKTMVYGYRAAWKVLDTYFMHFKRERKVYNVRNIIADGRHAAKMIPMPTYAWCCS